MEALFSNTLIDLNIIHDGFVLITNVLKAHDNMKEENKNLKGLISLLKILVRL